ncbi:COPII subunit, partial [Tulasnella sp. 408]
MADPSQQLPPGWITQWDETHQRYLFIDQNTGQSQWEPPALPGPGVPAPGPAPAGHGKRRQYAAAQAQAYYGESGVVHPPAPGDMAGNAVGGSSFFTPAGGDQAPPAQSSQFYNNAPAIGQGQGVFSAGGFVVPAQPSAYQQQQPQVGALADQFGQMGLQGGYGQKQFALHTVNLVGAFLDPQELVAPPPEIRLPPGASVSQEATANADYTYQRCTMNAIPTTNSLLGKAKLPFGLILTPHRSLKEGDPAVPVITDQ